jgi:hypothetical protein
MLTISSLRGAAAQDRLNRFHEIGPRLRQEYLAVSHSVLDQKLDQEKVAVAGGKAARAEVKNERVQSCTV